MLYNSLGILIVEIFKYIMMYLILFPAVIIMILITICKTINKKNDNKIFSYRIIIISFAFSIVLSANINSFFVKSIASINGEKDSDLKYIINEVIDFNERKTEIIYAKTDEIKIYGRYYLDIRNGEYVIPLSDMAKSVIIKNLLYNNEYGEQMNFNNKIEVYKNTKFVKSINGIDINSDYDRINEFKEEQKYKIKINITEDGYLLYAAEGCTLDEFINNENAMVCIYNERGEEIVNTAQIFGNEYIANTFGENLNINSFRIFCHQNGTCYAYVCTRENKWSELEKVSNGIKFRVDSKKQIIDFNVIDSSQL